MNPYLIVGILFIIMILLISIFVFKLNLGLLIGDPELDPDHLYWKKRIEEEKDQASGDSTQ